MNKQGWELQVNKKQHVRSFYSWPLLDMQHQSHQEEEWVEERDRERETNSGLLLCHFIVPDDIERSFFTTSPGELVNINGGPAPLID